MQNPAQDSAMTEVALALAMGFFSLMVLTLISMGSGPASKDDRRPGPQSAAALDLIMPAASTSPAATETDENDILLFFDGHHFRDRNLATHDPAVLAQQALAERRRVVLAVDPGLSLERTMALRERLRTPDLVVTTYGADWRTRLEKLRGDDDEQ